MKKIVSAAFALLIFLVSCGPAAEDRQMMHSRAKVFQDSIANMIRVSMEEAAAPSNVVVIPQPTAAPAATPAPQK